MTAPPIPAEVDLRDFPFIKLYRHRLFGSTFNATATDTEWRAGVTLWFKSWDQVPGGSLPNDDGALCRLAELGRDLKTWRKIKAMALHGWRLCDDGRLYHDVVAEIVTEAWDAKLARSNRTEKARAARQSQRKRDGDKSSVTDGASRQQTSVRRAEKEKEKEIETDQNHSGSDLTSLSDQKIASPRRARARGRGADLSQSARAIQTEAFFHVANELDRNCGDGRETSEPLRNGSGTVGGPPRNRS